MRRALASLGALVLLGAGLAWVLSAPDPLPAAELAALQGDPVHGERVFHAAGCASCHVAPDSEQTDRPVLAGGQRFVTQFGTFVAPNISPSPQGIGDWTQAEVMNAVLRGVSPDGQHYYPSFPWNAYWKAEPRDVADLVAYMRTLPASEAESQPHEIPFPFNIRRAVGGWKLLFLQDDWVVGGDLTEQQEHGRYLVEALGHCDECHTPRNALGGLRTSAWLSGAQDPAGEGWNPNITPAGLHWSEAEIVAMLQSGFTPEFDVVGGEMAAVVSNTSRLADGDLWAIAAYLKAVPPLEPALSGPGAGAFGAAE